MKNQKEALSSVKITTTALCFLALSGCISPQMKTSMGDYGQVYSEASNRQLLMNLARMEQGHPPYFFQMGQISAYYTVSGNLGWGDTYPATGPWSTSGSIGASAAHSPTFTFVPLSGSRFSEQWLKPIAPEIFSALVQQGFPVDVLMRLCVQSIEFDLGRPNTNGTAAASQNFRHGKRRNRAEPENKGEYEAFLRDCGLLKDLQDMGALGLVSVNVSEPVDDVILRTPPSDAQRLQASEKGATWTADDAGNWRLCRTSSRKVFTIDADNPNYATRIQELIRQPWYAGKSSTTNTLKLLSKPDRTGMSLALSMHSPMFAMDAAAKEQRQFEELAKDSGFLERLPPSQRHPVMRLRWARFARDRQDPVVALTYRGVYYALADELQGKATKPPTWNRDAFSLLLLLMSQSDVDVTKINYQQYLQVR